jgi:hypothetical protein
MSAPLSDSNFHLGQSEPLDALTVQWMALREAAEAVAQLAGPDVAALAGLHLAFPQGLRQAPKRRQMMIEQAIGDLVAMMEPGVAALLSVHERGGQTEAAARALWQEFVAARGGLLALVPPEADATQL